MNELKNESLMTPQDKNYIIYWVLDNDIIKWN